MGSDRIVGWNNPSLWEGPSERLDAHVHLDFMRNAHEVAKDARTRGITLFANSVTIDGFVRVREAVEGSDNVLVGLGMHPWWYDEADLERFDALLPSTAFVGEVGLDFSPRRFGHERQVEIFRHVARSCAAAGNKTLSIHAVRSVTPVLDILTDTACIQNNRCILHWFSGSTEELWRAIRAGCWFSVNEMQARTRRAKEQLRLIPEDRLLLETDLPPGPDVVFSVDDLQQSLQRAADLLARIRAERT